MAKEIGWFFDQKLVEKALAEYGTPEQYFNGFYMWPEEKRRELQDRRLRAEVQRASKVPMYQRLWQEKGFDPSTFRGLEDLHKIPMYTIEDIRESINRCPPYGDYQGVYPDTTDEACRIFFSGGTTGTPRPTVYTAWDRVVASLISSRQFYMHGLRPGDVVLNSFAYSTHNGAFINDEICWYWMKCPVITCSTGVVTSSRKQLQLARDYGAVTILTTADYLLKLRATADEMGLKPSDFNFKFFSTIGDTKAVEEAWGVPTYEFYAFHEVQCVAISCREKQGMHIFEDAFIVEVVDSETGEPLPDGEVGDLVVTCLYKTGSPQIRFNIKDLSSIIPEPCACGSGTKRITPLAGRSDCMVKLRGINVWPEAIGSILSTYLGKPKEYFCIAYKKDGQEYIRTLIELEKHEFTDGINERLSEELKNKCGVKIEVQAVAKDALAELTGAGKVLKLKRFADERKNSEPSPAVAKFFHW